MKLTVSIEVLERLRPLFASVEGQCEVWTDDEVARRMFIRGAMEYAKSAGTSWDDTMALAADLRAALTTEE